MSRAPQPFPRSLIVIMAGFGLLVMTLPLVFWFQLEYYEVCPVCARKRDVQEWLVPFTYHPYYHYAVIHETPLSVVVEELGYVDPHEHDWLRVHGFGPGTREIHGEGFPIAQGLVTPQMGEFVRLIHRHLTEEEVAYWFARMTHPQHAYVVRNIADQCVLQQYADTAAFRARLDEVASEQRRLQAFRLGVNIDEPQTRTPPRLLYERP